MIVNFNELQETAISNLNEGNGIIFAKMFINPNNKIMISRLPVGASIGMHQHKTSSEINYVISGLGKSICNDIEEELSVGNCQYCSKGLSHNIINIGMEDLILFTVVTEQ